MNAAGEREFTERVEPYRAELHAHCYRMLGSVYDADDALQETMLRAWRGAAGLRQTGFVRSWLYAIATNVCLTELQRRRRRALPQDLGPSAEPHTPPGAPLAETTWIEPYPDAELGLPAGPASPEARMDQREGVELAFVAALQHLAASQRAVLRTLGDRGLRELVGRYVEAWERCDVEGFTQLLAADASFAMPPLSTWYTPRETIAAWARESSLSGAWQWRTVLTSANAQPALAFYSWDEAAGVYLPFALNVLSFRGGLVSDVTAFIVRATASADPQSYVRFPEQPMDARRLTGSFARFALPEQLRGGDRPPRGADRPPRAGDRPPRGGDRPPRGGDRPPRAVGSR